MRKSAEQSPTQSSAGPGGGLGTSDSSISHTILGVREVRAGTVDGAWAPAQPHSPLGTDILSRDGVAANTSHPQAHLSVGKAQVLAHDGDSGASLLGPHEWVDLKSRMGREQMSPASKVPSRHEQVGEADLGNVGVAAAGALLAQVHPVGLGGWAVGPQLAPVL